MTEAHGTIGDEAGRLLDAVQDWARRNLGDGIATGAPECAWCPICRLVAALRGDRPDVNDKIAEAATSVVAALRAIVDAAATSRPAEPPAPGVQHIDLGS